VALLEIDNLRTRIVLPRRTVQAVDDISFQIDAGETVGLVGESGSGKSMTAASILRLLPPGGQITSGRVALDGVDLTALSDKAMNRVRGKDVGVVFQDPMTALNPTMTIGNQVAEPLLIHGTVSSDRVRARTLELLDMVGVPRPAERIDTYPHELSGGLRQRVCIAIALACEPKLLIADEPTTALDVSIQDQILSLLHSLKRELGMAILLVTHDMGVVASHADRVMVMYAGKIVETASRTELFGETRHPYTEALLKSLPRLDQDAREALYTILGTPPDLSDPAPYCRFAPRCAFATSECTGQMPELTGDRGGHQWACFHPRGLTATPAPARPLLPIAPPAEIGGPEPLMQLADVVKEFPLRAGFLQRVRGSVKAVSGVSLTLYRGEVFGLVGESGCGKSTIGRLMVALDRPDSGTIDLDGVDVTALRGRALRRRRRDLQMVFQDPYASLDPRMRVRAILAEPMIVQRLVKRRQRDERVADLLREVGLPDDSASRLPREFSGGQRQRIGFARALTVSPRLIVADEPVSALDVSIRSHLLNLMKRLQGSHDLAFVMISHDLSVVRYIADRVGVMYLGKLVEVGKTRDVYDAPAHPYTAGLLEAIPEPDPAKAAPRDRAAIRGELPSALDPPSGCRFRTRCPRAAEICAEVEPAMTAVSPATVLEESAHSVACHFPLLPVVTAQGLAGDR
jgi:oligopeptide/dipeptide ABC transporter ATP-binding protein